LIEKSISVNSIIAHLYKFFFFSQKIKEAKMVSSRIEREDEYENRTPRILSLLYYHAEEE
jgi:hypothetical protein